MSFRGMGGWSTSKALYMDLNTTVPNVYFEMCIIPKMTVMPSVVLDAPRSTLEKIHSRWPSNRSECIYDP